MSIADKGQNPIDAVLLWVNGNDPAHQKKMQHYVKDQQKFHSKGFRTRFDQVEEIQFSVDSIIKYAPYIKNIFIVTDKQVPTFLNSETNHQKYSKVKIVDHTEIFIGYEKYLPTFNCRSIETQIYKIPELAENFIYFNDDMILLNPTNQEDFFIDNKPVIRGKWLQFDENLFYKKFKKEKKEKGARHKIAQQRAAKLIGFNKYYKFHHTPSPLRKSTFMTYFENNKEVEIRNIKHKFRHAEQFTPQGLANHLEIKRQNCVLNSDYQLCYIQSYSKPRFWYTYKLAKSGKNSHKLFLCVQSLDLASKNIQSHILKWIDEKLKN